jgi:hypothetical protein
LIEIAQVNNISDEGIGKFVMGTSRAVFFFDQDVVDYLDHLRRQSIELQKLVEFLRTAPVGPERSQASQQRSALFLWFTDQFEEVVKRFKPFMALTADAANQPRPPT